MKRTYIILGCHRSGTSLTAMLCYSAGLHLGRELYGALPSNPMGHYEAVDFMYLQENLLKEAGGNWFNVPDFFTLEKVFLRHLNEIKHIIEKNKKDVWGWKDPRNSIFFPFYIKYKLIEYPHLIICWRNAYSVAKSIEKRDKFSFDKALSIVISYYDIIRKNLARFTDIPTLHILYENYFLNPERECLKLKEFLKLNKMPNINLIKKDLKHF